MDAIQEKSGLSKRHACRIVGQHRGTQRYVPTVLDNEDALTRAIIGLASEYGRYDYRRVTALLQAEELGVPLSSAPWPHASAT